MKNVYSIVLSGDVVSKIDRLAYENGTNRSNMINQILADYVSLETPEKRFREIFREMQNLLSGGTIKMTEPSDTMLSMRSALDYKYNPTVKYNVELYRHAVGENPEIGELRVSMRTQNAGLTLAMMQFYKLWMRIESSYRGEIPSLASDGKFTRKLVLQNRSGIYEFDVGKVLAAYINAFDEALKLFFEHLDMPQYAVKEVEMRYRKYLHENAILI